MSVSVVARAVESTHHRLIEFAKTALTKVFLFPYATVCELYCAHVPDADKFDQALISHYIGIDVEASGICQAQEAWDDDSQRKSFTYDFFHLDPCTDNLEPALLGKCNTVDVVCCMQQLQSCFESEDRARTLLLNVSALLKPGGYFIGITPDSSTIWAKYQKNVEAYHSRSSAMKPNMMPNCIRSESYMITFEVEEEKFPLFGKKYQLKFASDASGETHCLVHFPSFIRLAREAGLEYVEIQNLTEFYDDNRAQFASLIMKFGPNLVDPRGRLLPRSYDVLGLYTTFIFQKPDPERIPPIRTPLLCDGPYDYDETQIYDEGDWQGTDWRDDEKTETTTEPPPGPSKLNDHKGILGPGPADLRFSEAL